jgi:hypothetical protein
MLSERKTGNKLQKIDIDKFLAKLISKNPISEELKQHLCMPEDPRWSTTGLGSSVCPLRPEF